MQKWQKIAGGAAAVALGAGITASRRWWTGGPSLAEADRAAQDEHALFDRGLIGIERSGWTMPEGEAPPFPMLEESLSADVVIVGAGLAGSSIALHLAEAGVSAVVLEARQPAWGASGRNAGHVLPTLRDAAPFRDFPDQGQAFFNALGENRGITFAIAQKYGIACDAVQAGYLTAARSSRDIARLRKNTAWMEERGLLDAHEIGGADLQAETGTRHWDYGLALPEGGRVNPYLFTQGMIRSAAALGAKVFGDSPAISLTRNGARWKVRTPRGDVTADRVMFCTAAYPDGVIPELTRAFYPLSAYALTTKPLPAEASAIILPAQRTLEEAPIDLNPMVRDHHNRLIFSSIPETSKPEDSARHFQRHLNWLHRVWPETRAMKIELEAYWTGRVALRDSRFPGTFEMGPGLYGLMYFNAWGNMMAPLLGKLFAQSLASDRMDTLPFPLSRPEPVANLNKQDRLIRHILIPAARNAQRWKLL